MLMKDMLRILIIQICHSKLVLHGEPHFIKQAKFTGLYHEKGNSIRIIQEPFPPNVHSDHLQIIFHLYVTLFFVLEDFYEIHSV